MGALGGADAVSKKAENGRLREKGRKENRIN